MQPTSNPKLPEGKNLSSKQVVEEAIESSKAGKNVSWSQMIHKSDAKPDKAAGQRYTRPRQ